MVKIEVKKNKKKCFILYCRWWRVTAYFYTAIEGFQGLQGLLRPRTLDCPACGLSVIGRSRCGKLSNFWQKLLLQRVGQIPYIVQRRWSLSVGWSLSSPTTRDLSVWELRQGRSNQRDSATKPRLPIGIFLIPRFSSSLTTFLFCHDYMPPVTM